MLAASGEHLPTSAGDNRGSDRMRIAVFAHEEEMSSYYRAYEPVEALGRRGHGGLVNMRDEEPNAQMLECDVALISRWSGPITERLVQALRRAGLGVVWQIDDAVEFSTFVNPRSRRVREQSTRIRSMLRLADVVITTTDDLADHFGASTKAPIRVVENYLGPHFERVEREPHRGLVLGWAAWIDHMADWRALGLQETVMRLLEAHPDLRVESLGPIDLRLPPERYSQRPPVRFEFLARRISEFDVGIAPIADNRFNAARSNIKVKEYAALGIPWLASPIGPYAGLGEKEGGRLVADDRWYEELDRLVRDGRGRKKLAKRGRAWAATQTIDRNAELWEDVFDEAIGRARARRSGAA
jgi:glycosyltransferase involved in cell wall biosynthesis